MDVKAFKGKERKSRHHNFYAQQKETVKTIDMSVFYNASNRLENNINLLLKLLK
jgi:hypothetical protein